MSKGKAQVKYMSRSGLVTVSDAPDWGFLYTTNSVIDPEFNIGDRVVTPDGRVFRYAKAAGSVLSSFGAAMGDYVTISAVAPAQTTPADPGFPAPAAVQHGSLGAKTVLITVASGNGHAGDGVVAQDELRGGYIVLANQGSSAQNRGIIGNTAVASGGGTCVIYLDAPLTAAVVASTTYIEVMPNPYRAMVPGGGKSASKETFLGVPVISTTTGKYFWLQTWGPLWIVPGGGDPNGPGYGAGDRDVYFVGDGSINGAKTLTIENGYQRAGSIMQADVAGNYAGPPFVMLQVSI